MYTFIVSSWKRFGRNAFQGDDYENEERIFWPSNDPMLIADGFYCIGVILAFARILYIFQISQVYKIVKIYVFLPLNISRVE